MAQTVQPGMKKGQRFKFFGDIIAELKKVTWLSRRETLYLTGLVLIVSVAAGLIMGAVDSAFSFLIEKLFTGS
jgi:preprotein translocase subunit SecE